MRYQGDLDHLDSDAIDELHKGYAHDLKDALQRIGVECNVHWDRSPWGVRIGLVPGEYRDATYEEPSLFVLTETRTKISGYWAQEWSLTIGNCGDEGTTFDNIFGHILERPWLGETPDHVAHTVATYAYLLTHGAAKAKVKIEQDEQDDREDRLNNG